jgi:gluconokinase
MFRADTPHMESGDTHIISLDVGTSSVRTLLYDARGTAVDGFGEHVAYTFTATPDGGVEIDPEKLFSLCVQCLSRLHEQMQAAGRNAAAVGFSAFWHSFFGVDSGGRPVTPFLHLFDTRSEPHAERLAKMLDEHAVHQRTGCRFHASYWPAKLLWLSDNVPDGFARTTQWLSFGEFLYLRLFGAPALSTSMVSATGLWNLRENRYDDEVLRALPIRRDQLSPEGTLDQPSTALQGEWKARWPLFDGIPWYPALGDGACNNVGSGCVSPGTFALMVGTSGAMRAVTGAATITIPDGLWCYRVDAKRYIPGGALSNGGEVYAWMKRHLALPDEAEAESELLKREPGKHGLTVLPFFAGERSPWWRADLQGAITGLNLATTSLDILQASLESVALNFARILALMRGSIGPPQRIIASGGALAHSHAWTRMMADALGTPVLSSCEVEASSRGAALLALERLGVMKIEDAAVRTGEVFQPSPERHSAYAALLENQSRVMAQLYPEN